MPLAEFIGPDGAVIERLVQDTAVNEVEEDGVLYRRAPFSLFSVNRRLPAHDQRAEVYRGYYHEECRGGRFRSKYSKDDIKRVWDKPLKD